MDAPGSLKGSGALLGGLCGNFNGDAQDDFMTPEGDVEAEEAEFGDRSESRIETC